MDVLLRLLPKGKYAAMGYYDRLSCRQLQFDIRLTTKTVKNYITLEEYPMTCLAISGATYKGGCNCQQIDAISKYRDRVSELKLRDFDRLIRIWREYHLNDLTAGTFAQEEALKEWKKTHKYDYTAACKYLEERELLVDKGYKYGTGWLCKPIPSEDVEFLMRLPKIWREDDWLG
ncbi:MAG: hypothetical protein IJX55_10915 [Clostridia bacterium]|nr:hypothetical protein [Clostridia bacterium]